MKLILWVNFFNQWLFIKWLFHRARILQNRYCWQANKKINRTKMLRARNYSSSSRLVVFNALISSFYRRYTFYFEFVSFKILYFNFTGTRELFSRIKYRYCTKQDIPRRGSPTRFPIALHCLVLRLSFIIVA